MKSHAQDTTRSAMDPIPFWKRALDITCLLLTLPCWLLVGFLVGILVKVASPGPVLFRQLRIGYLGRPFWLLKFRTMQVNADSTVHLRHLSDLMRSGSPMTKLDAADSRLIPCGLLLRSLGLDELPQIINVFRGEMSLVGPRPCLPYEYEKYLPRHRLRLQTLPGLTGLWQTSGKNKTTFDEMIDLDVHYAQHKSLLLDLKIIFRTVPALLEQAIQAKQTQKTEHSASNQSPRPCAVANESGLV